MKYEFNLMKSYASLSTNFADLSFLHKYETEQIGISDLSNNTQMVIMTSDRVQLRSKL